MRLHSAGLVGQEGILRAGWQAALGGHLQASASGLSTRRGLPTCPTNRHFPSPYLASLNGPPERMRAISTACNMVAFCM